MTVPSTGLRPDRLTDCPKLMTNGPCGGVALDGTCEVDRRACFWADAVNAAGTSLSVFPSPPRGLVGARTVRPGAGGDVGSPLECRHLDKDQRPWRQKGRFETVLRDGGFAVTAELDPPDSADANAYLELVKPPVGLLDAVHISDNSLASPHMCGSPGPRWPEI
jgi:hypothetical protein